MLKRSKKIEWNRLLVSIAMIEAIGIIGGFFSAGAIDGWYMTLNKPWFNPPNWIFGPVWTVLYLMLAIAWYWLWIDKKGKKLSKIKVLFWVQVGLNALWSPAFFILRSVELGLVVMVSLWLTLTCLLKELRIIRPKIFWVLVPYFVWVSFAAVLNLSIWMLN